MATALLVTGAQHLDPTTIITLPANEDVSVRYIIRHDSTENFRALWAERSGNSNIFRPWEDPLQTLIKPESGTFHYLSYASSLEVDTWYDRTLKRVGGVWDIVDTQTQTSVLTAPSEVDNTEMRIERFFQRKTSDDRFIGAVQLIEIDAGTNGTYVYDPDNANQSANPLTIPETTQNNDAVGTGFNNSSADFESVGTSQGTITITETANIFRKYLGDGVPNHTLEGTYTGTGTDIEYQVGSGAWTVGESNISGNTFSFTIPVPIGEHTVNVRFSGDTTPQDTTTLVTPELVVAVGLAQSNASGRGTNNQTYTQAGGVKAYLFGNDDVYKELSDPYDSSTGQIDGVSSDSAGGSWILRFAHHWIANKGTPIAFVPCAKGDTRIDEWQKTDSTRVVDGLNLYQSMSRRINAVGGVDVIFAQVGETDAGQNTPKATYKTLYNQVVSDIQTDFGCPVFIVPLHTITMAGFAGNAADNGQDAIREAQVELASENANISIGQSLTDIDISDTDGLHFQNDDELDTIGLRMYQSYTGSVSNLTVSITGIPDGTYNTLITDTLNNTVYANTVTYTSGTTTINGLSVASGTALRGFVISGDELDGAVITGTTV